jgi:hypothetical protein
MTTVRYADGGAPLRRQLSSTPLALHQADHNLVYAGLRSGKIQLHDLRIPASQNQIVGRMQQGKAVVGVKRLKDDAVPYGVLASGMGSEVSLLRLPEAAKADLRCSSSIYDIARPHFEPSKVTSIPFTSHW